MSTIKTESYQEIFARRIREVLQQDPNLYKILRKPGVYETLTSSAMSLDRMIAYVLESYEDRPALAERQYTVKKNDNNQFIRLYHTNFQSITYRQLHLRIKQLANVWQSNSTYALSSGDLVCFLGTTGIDHVTVEFSMIYNHIGIVPLSSSGNRHELEKIFQQIQPKAIITNPKDLSLAVDLARKNKTIKHIIAINFDLHVTEDDMYFQTALNEIKQFDSTVHLISLNQLLSKEVKEDWTFLPTSPQSEQRIVRILYTSGSTGTPKGAVYTEKQEKTTWQMRFARYPVIIMMVAPFNHLMGRGILIASLVRGGICYFPSNNNLSSIFEDIRLVRPTCLCLFPRFLEFIYDYYQTQTKNLMHQKNEDFIHVSQQVKQAIGQKFLGDRLIIIEVSGAPVAEHIKQFMAECFDVCFAFSYASTESVGIISINNYLFRSIVKDYKLCDVPELGFLKTDKPYPRGELCIKTISGVHQYYQNQNVTNNLIDKDGFIHLGDIVEDRGNDNIIVIGRRKDVIKLSQGEFIALGKLTTLFETHSRLIHQIYIYGNSHFPYLLAVIVPDKVAFQEMIGSEYDPLQLKPFLQSELQQVASQLNLKAFEIPKDFIIEMEPFSEKNGLLSSLHKRLNKAFIEKYGDRLEALYLSLKQNYHPATQLSKHVRSRNDVLEQLIELIKINLNQQNIDESKKLTYAQLGGDSINAIGLAMSIKEQFGIPFSADILLNPTGSIQHWVDTIVSALNSKQTKERTFENIHGLDATLLKAGDLSLNRMIDQFTLKQAKTNPYSKYSKTVLLTGANGFLGRFICLEWLRKLSPTGGKLICIIRADNDAAAFKRIDDVFIGGDKALEQEYVTLKEKTLDVIAGDISQIRFGLDEVEYQRLAEKVDRVVHAAALVSHIMSYEHLFATNVVGTAEIIRFALTHINKPIDYISSVAIEPCLQRIGHYNEDTPLKEEIVLSDQYANGYAASKWASEQLLRQTSAQYGLTVTIFRNNMMLAHQIYKGQINTRDFFTRLLYSVIVTGLAPLSFYISKDKPGHYDGIPVNIASSCIVAIGESYHHQCQTYTMQNYHTDDGCSLDVFIDWIIKAGYPIQKISNYQEWFKTFETALLSIEKSKQQNSILALLSALSYPLNPEAAVADCDHFKILLKNNNPPIQLPQLDEAFILKCIDDMKRNLFQF